MQQEPAQISSQCAAILRDAIFSIIPGTINTKRESATRVSAVIDTSKEEEDVVSSDVVLKDRFPFSWYLLEVMA